jgi:hypothetical protein
MRLYSEPFRVAVEATADMMDAHGLLPPAPKSLNGATVSDMIRDGTVRINVDGKYPQAIGIGQIADLARMFESFDWELLHSPSSLPERGAPAS